MPNEGIADEETMTQFATYPSLKGRSVLVTGGATGIGEALVTGFAEQGARVAFFDIQEDAGRQLSARLAAAGCPEPLYLHCDITDLDQVRDSVSQAIESLGGLDVLINNAGQANVYKLDKSTDAYEKAAEEIQANYLSVVRLTEKLLPLLSVQKEAAIVNVTSIVAFAPGVTLPTYSASKAALRSYSQILRYTLAGTNVKVFELLPPLVNTELSVEIGGENGIPPLEVAEGLLAGFENDEYELHIGQTANLYKLFLSSPEQALLALNQGR